MGAGVFACLWRPLSSRAGRCGFTCLVECRYGGECAASLMPSHLWRAPFLLGPTRAASGQARQKSCCSVLVAPSGCMGVQADRAAQVTNKFHVCLRPSGEGPSISPLTVCTVQDCTCSYWARQWPIPDESDRGMVRSMTGWT